MEELVKDVFTAPVGTIFVLAGVLFMFIAVIGKISGKIEPGLKARVLAGVLGSVFISIGLAMNWPSLAERTTAPPLPVKTPQPSTPPESPTETLTHTKPAGDNIPDLVPRYPGNVQSLSIIRRDGGQYGSFFFWSDQQPGDVLTFYQTNLEMNRWEVTKKEGTLSAVNEGGSQSIAVTSGEDKRFHPFTPWKYAVTFSESKRK